MRVNPRRYALCMECSDISSDTLEPEYTVQWLVDAPEPRRGSWGARKPATYRCEQCGEDNY